MTARSSRRSRHIITLVAVLATLVVCGAAAAATAAAAGWEDQSPGVGSDCWLESVAAISVDEAWTAGSTPSFVLHTTNGGTDWLNVDCGISGDIKSLAFAGQNGWVAAHKYSFPTQDYDAHTSDGGATWVNNPPATGTVDRFAPVPGTTDSCWGWRDLGSTPKLQFTSDGGANWAGNAAWTTGSYASPQAGSCIDANNALFLASDKVYRTTDGGSSWTVNDPEPPSYLAYMDFVTATTGWVAGGNGYIARTTDGGTSWATVSLPVTPPLTVQVEGFDFVNANDGWLLTSAGTIWQTTDGGTHWAVQTYRTDKILLAIAAASSTNAWITGTEGLILHTTDGGGPVDATPPTVAVTGATGWVNSPTHVYLTVNDLPGVGPWKAYWKWETDAVWSSAFSWPGYAADVAVPAPADHSRDGLHTLTYYGLDYGFNKSADQTEQVNIDTVLPTVTGTKNLSVLRGKFVVIRYTVKDPQPCGGKASMTLVVLKKLTQPPVVLKAMGPARVVGKSYTFRYRVKLKKGTYKYLVSAKDTAGNGGDSMLKRLVVK